MNWETERPFLVELAMASADVIRPRFLRPNLPTALKEDVSPVTEADREAELVMRRMIESRFPAHGILGEEYGTVRADAEFVWVLDPIDGTKSFITGVPLFATLIGLLHRGRPVLGCIHQPILNQLMIGDGQVTTLNGAPVRARRCAGIGEATLLTTDPLGPARHQDGPAFDRLAAGVRLYRTFGDA
jgi:myo-inositol-1(or 4)-monophosphatase